MSLQVLGHRWLRKHGQRSSGIGGAAVSPTPPTVLNPRLPGARTTKLKVMTLPRHRRLVEPSVGRSGAGQPRLRKPGQPAVGSSVTGGESNEATQVSSSVPGGKYDTASGGNSWAAGGYSNTAVGHEASVSGGAGNTAEGTSSSISGGGLNKTKGQESSISGGEKNVAEGKGNEIPSGVGRTKNLVEPAASWAGVFGEKNKKAKNSYQLILEPR